MSAYTGTFAGYPISFNNAKFYLLSESSYFVSPSNALNNATYIRVHFRFNKGGTGNLQERTFNCFPEDRSYFCPLLAALCALDRWASCNLDPLNPIFCYLNMKVVTLIHESVFTKNLCKATLQV